jgi:hypothetical protein
LAPLATIAALGLLALGASSASATTTLRLDPGNVPFSGTTTITNTTSSSAIWSSGAGSMSCPLAKFTANLNSHSSATNITGSLTSLTFARTTATACTSTLPVNYDDCSLHGGTIPTVSITSNATGGTVVLGDVLFRCRIVGPATPTACYFTWPTATGAENNAASTITFSGVSVTAVGNPAGTTDGQPAGVCGTSATFSVTFRHIVQRTTNKTVTITTA